MQLGIKLISKDKKQDYQETDLMLQQAHALATEYQVKIEQAQQNALEQAKQLPIQSRYRQQLAENLRESAKQNEALALFEIEKQVLEKADQIFLVLKNNRWENKNNTFMFYVDKALKQFNTLYQEVVKLNSQMQQIQQQNRTALQEKHD